MARVLIVDDDSDIVHLLVELLQSEGHHTAAALGHAVLPLAIDWQPQLILLDLMMPELDGFVLNHALRNELRTSSIPIVAMSAGYYLKEHRDELDVQGFLPKPFNLSDVLNWVERLATPVPAPSADGSDGLHGT